MKKQFVIIGIIVLLSSIQLSGCEEQNIRQADKEKFIGTWYGNQVSDFYGSQNITIIFNSSGNVDWGDSLPHTYRVEGDKLYIGYGELASGEDAYIYSFKNAPAKDLALGSNLIGAAFGGLLESISFITGIKALLLIVLLLYVFSFFFLSILSVGAPPDMILTSISIE